MKYKAHAEVYFCVENINHMCAIISEKKLIHNWGSVQTGIEIGNGTSVWFFLKLQTTCVPKCCCFNYLGFVEDGLMPKLSKYLLPNSRPAMLLQAMLYLYVRSISLYMYIKNNNNSTGEPLFDVLYFILISVRIFSLSSFPPTKFIEQIILGLMYAEVPVKF